MKPIRLELQAFGPYVTKQVIDFEKLSEKGIFLIKGPTGSGKTTIFDAMTFALYGGSSGETEKAKSGRNDLEEWRCSQADDKTATYVSFTFSVRGRRYVFTRKLEMKRKNLSTLYEAGEIDEAGNVIPFFERPKKDDLTQKAEELIGLTKDQFRQVVLLPQGQFERFLTAPSGEKEDILKKIFGAEQWEKYAQAFSAEAEGRKRQLDEEKASIDSSLSEEGLSSVDELKALIAEKKTEQDEIGKAHEEFAGKQKQDALIEDRNLFERFRPLHELEQKMCALEEQKEELAEKRRAYEQAEAAETLRNPIVSYEDAQEQLQKREQDRCALESGFDAARTEEAAAKEEKTKHEQQSPVAELMKKRGIYEEKRDTYEGLQKLREAYAAARAVWETASEVNTDAEKAYDTAVSKAQSSKTDYDRAEQDAKEARDRYYAGIYGEIAASLTDETACPVCGSTVHPHPAQKLPDSISKEEVDEKEETAARLKRLWDKAEQQRLQAEQNRNEKRALLSKAETDRETAKATLEAAGKNLIDGIADVTALEEAISAIDESVNAYRTETERLNEAHAAALQKLNELTAKIYTAKAEEAAAQEALALAKEELDRLLVENGYTDYLHVKSLLIDNAERTKLHEEIVGYATSCESTAEELEKKKNELHGKEEPDSAEFEQRQKEIDTESETFNAENAKLKTTIERLEKKHKSLSDKQAHFDAEIMQAESDLAFARKLRGGTGVGLPRYVLAVMFNQVIGEANQMLSKVHGGRYYLFRSDDKGSGNKRGLELKVHDNRSPEKEGRSVSMLSGGEKFLVSLSLSIGMSAVAQKSGVQIEALFIDEGFGTLDDSSIHDALDVLDGVRKGSGIVGIISHVALLEDNIPTHLEVVKSEAGSSIVLR